ncbi:MAG: recombinase family protein [Rubrivivax sp.]
MKALAVACAIYTRKSSEEGLDQGFNSLDAQREACAAFIVSQKAFGWTALPNAYDDGGFSGGNVERPALRRLLADIAAKRVQVIVVYKVDRLTRSLADFAKLVEVFDVQGVSFVSVTQQFNTTSSMGRLTLNVLLSLAQFEREVTGERIRDKIAASKRKGMWMGGVVPVGYTPDNRTLAIDPVQAERVRQIYQLYLELNCVRLLGAEAGRRGWTTPERITRRVGWGGGRPFSRGHLYRILSNPIYAGRIVHKGELFAGNHPALIEPSLWQAVQDRLDSNRQGHRVRAKATSPSLLAGLVFDDQSHRLTPSHATKGARRYRYYVGPTPAETGTPTLRIPAQELENAVTQAMVTFLGDESRLLGCMGSVAAQTVQERLQRARAVGASLRASIGEDLRRIVQRIDVGADSILIVARLAAVWGSRENDDDATTEIKVPAKLARCGMGVRLVVNAPGATARRQPDPTMMALLAKAHDWAKQLTTGRSRGILSIAKTAGVGSSYANRVVHLAFLAPDIVQRIVRGEHPPQLNAQRLIGVVPLPIDWAQQRSLLGFDG